jgi:hypothetical protein
MASSATASAPNWCRFFIYIPDGGQGEAVNVQAPHHQEMLEEAIESCLHVIAEAEHGKEEPVFSEYARDAIQHAFSAVWDTRAPPRTSHSKSILLTLPMATMQRRCASRSRSCRASPPNCWRSPLASRWGRFTPTDTTSPIEAPPIDAPAPARIAQPPELTDLQLTKAAR